MISLMALAASGLGAQTPAVAELRPDATLEEPYSLIRGLVELPDGRVVVADQRENALYLASFDGGERQTLGRNGEGPHEYASLVGLFPGPADTTYAYDIKNARIALATPGGIPSVLTFRELGAEGVYPRFVDRGRRMYWDNRSGTRIAKMNQPESDDAHRTVVMRTDGKGGIDTLASLETPGPVNPGPIAEWDFWAAGPGGSVAIVRNQDEYRVEWVGPDGSTVRGPVVDEERVRVGRADRDSLSRIQGASVGTPGGASRARRDVYLPDHFPFAKSVAVSPDGRAWVERALPVADDKPLFDVFGADGRRVARYRLQAGRVLVGFGRGTVYATREDDVGLKWVERYRVP